MEEGVSDIVESTKGVVRALEALYSEHRSIMITEGLGRGAEDREGGLSELYAAAVSEERRLEEGEREEEEEEEEEEFLIELKEKKQTVLEESLEKLQSGIGEATFMLVLASYVNSLEGDKQKLRAQVKRLCAENNWLRTELTSHQQMLQDTEVQMAKIKEDKEQLEFLLAQSRPGGSSADSSLPLPPRDQSPSMDIQEEETEGVNAIAVSSAASVSGGGAGDYEVPEKIKTLHHLVLQYVNQGKPDIAVPLCKKAVKDLERKKGKDNPDVASMLNILAVIYREQGKLKEATHVLQDTLEIREKVFGPAHPTVASTLNNLSVLYGKSGDYRTAEPYCKRALEIRQKLLGTNHPDVAKQFTNLAILCSHLGKYDEVEYYYQRAVEIYQTELGPDDPNVSKTMNNLAQCYLKQGKLQAAESIFKKVLATVQTRETGGGEVSHSHGQASWVLAGTDTPSTSPKKSHEEPYSDQGAWHKSVPVDSPTVSSTLHNLSTVYREQGRTNTAEELDRLTQENDLGPAQQARMAELLEGARSSDRPSSPSKLQAGRQRQSSRPFLAKSVRMLLGWQGNTPKQPEEDQGGAT